MLILNTENLVLKRGGNVYSDILELEMPVEAKIFYFNAIALSKITARPE
jgi:hypothetical protein